MKPAQSVKKHGGTFLAVSTATILVVLLCFFILAVTAVSFSLLTGSLKLPAALGCLALEAIIGIVVILGLGRLWSAKLQNCQTDNTGNKIAAWLPAKIKEERRSRLQQVLSGEREDFAFTICHEIKAPVRAIDGYARIFMDDYGQQLNGEALDMVSNIRHICKETIALIDKLLEYSKIADEEPDKEIIDLKKLITTVFNELKVFYPEEHMVRLEFATPIPAVIGDRLLFKLAIQNILANSLKFTRDRQPAVITTGFTEEGGRDIFFIRDNGVGFDMQFAEKLFGMFQRLHNDDEFEGSGIGLVTVKKIMEKHKGDVWIAGEIGKGATVYFTLAEENILK
jgi:light-regulated signal transduction histidine kinase (bacteriophytochrome)/uncharacterized integral membrane protein